MKIYPDFYNQFQCIGMNCRKHLPAGYVQSDTVDGTPPCNLEYFRGKRAFPISVTSQPHLKAF